MLPSPYYELASDQIELLRFAHRGRTGVGELRKMLHAATEPLADPQGATVLVHQVRMSTMFWPSKVSSRTRIASPRRFSPGGDGHRLGKHPGFRWARAHVISHQAVSGSMSVPSCRAPPVPVNERFETWVEGEPKSPYQTRCTRLMDQWWNLRPAGRIAALTLSPPALAPPIAEQATVPRSTEPYSTPSRYPTGF
jgi:hypothetical protein